MSRAKARTAAELATAVGALHREIDLAAAGVLGRLGAQLRCGPGCTECCQDELTVFEVEAAWILLAPALPQRALGSSPGRCALLDEDGRCLVYERRPYVCRTQGLPLRWLDEDDDGEVVERRDVCPLNEETLELLELAEEQCWTLGEFEGRLASLQAELDGGELRRRSLRSIAEELLARR